MKNDDDDENNDKSEDIKNGLLNDFNDLIFFGFSENPFKAPNLNFDRRFKTVFWFRTTVWYHGHGGMVVCLNVVFQEFVKLS